MFMDRIRDFKLPPELLYVNKILREAGYCCYLVGGAVRNQLLGWEVVDYDLATDAWPEAVFNLFKKVVPTGLRHGTVTVIEGEHNFEITTFRADGKYEDGRRPNSVAFAQTVEEDLKRRDFTINAMAMDIETRNLIDPHEGRKDLRDGIIRTVGNPHARFSEDGLRLFRACRFISLLGFILDDKTAVALGRYADMIKMVSPERVGNEWRRIIMSPHPALGLSQMEQSGLLKIIFPELADCVGKSAGERHYSDLFTHLLRTSELTPPVSLPLRMAALLHDLGKPQCAAPDGSFIKHEVYSSQMAREFMQRYRFSNKEIDETVRLISNHSVIYNCEWSAAAVRRFTIRIGEEYIEDIFKLRRADIYSARNAECPTPGLDELQQRIYDELRNKQALSVKDLAVNGRELMSELSLPSGPQVGVVLNYLFSSVLEDPTQNNREQLLNLGRRYIDNMRSYMRYE